MSNGGQAGPGPARSGRSRRHAGHGEHEEFDQVYMHRLFDYAYQLSVTGYPWRKTLPFEADP